jgi:hypothetical protein
MVDEAELATARLTALVDGIGVTYFVSNPKDVQPTLLKSRLTASARGDANIQTENDGSWKPQSE